MAAYDNYRQPDHHSQYQNTAYDSASYDSRQYQSSHHPGANFQDHQRPHSRGSSSAPSDSLPGQQPLNNAVNHAFDKSDAARTVDPELIAQITAEVRKSLLEEFKAAGVGATVQPQPHPQAPPQHYVPQSPTSTSASFPTRNVYTPPSPRHPDFSSQGSLSPDPLSHDPLFDGADDTPTPRVDRTASESVPLDGTRRTRPAPSQRMSTEADFSPIERKWQRLFDPQGLPTQRLGQFLRGLAIHLIDDYEPKKSLVISPDKMLKFYEDVRLAEETYPWQTVFGKLQYATLGKIYREMRCQHHYIQEHIAEQPIVPALTPKGFEDWMTAMIQAYPDAEYERLSKAVLDMPISNADDAKERFPKELPRRLFPTKENLQAQQRCAAALALAGISPLRRAPTFPPPPPMNQNNPSMSGLERERSPYASQASAKDSRAVESEDEAEGSASIQIERERKPYSAQPGGGKMYEDDLSRSLPSETTLPDRRRRAQSTTSTGQWVPPNGHQHHPRTGSSTHGHRPRSPSCHGYGNRSDPSVRDIPGSYYATNMYDADEENRRFAREAELKRNDWARRQAEEDGPAPGAARSSRRSATSTSEGSYDSQPRSAYDDEYYRGRGGSGAYDNRGYESRRY